MGDGSIKAYSELLNVEFCWDGQEFDVLDPVTGRTIDKFVTKREAYLTERDARLLNRRRDLLNGRDVWLSGMRDWLNRRRDLLSGMRDWQRGARARAAGRG